MPMTTPSAATAPAPPGDRCTLEEFLGRMVDRWQEPLARVPREHHDEALAALELAEAALRLSRAAGRPPQVAVVGPTQTGKSTVVNLLLGGNNAGVSPLAGYTVHAHGFSLGGAADEAWLGHAFPRFERCEPGAISRETLAALTLEPVAGPSDSAPQVVWDTPDFDSLASADYRRAVLECSALADVLVLVVSKEKYADLSVWRYLELVAPLRTPLVVVLNKMTDDAAATIQSAVEKRLGELADVPAAIRLVALPFSAALRATGEGMDRAAVRRLRECVAELVNSAPDRRLQPLAGPLRLVRRGWEEWTTPILAQQRVWREWEAIVASEVKGAAEAYERDFLEHPQRYDSFRRATLELLRMIELPVVGTALGQARELVSGLARNAWAYGRRLFSQSSSEPPPEPPSAETLVLENVVDRCLFGVAREALRRCRGEDASAAAWQALSERLEQDEVAHREHFREAAAAARIGFGHEVHATADRLLSLLKERPGLLNTLRAARATTDVASIALAIKTGGTPVHDLLLAPAMFAFTSLLTEGALGKYMTSVARDLRIRQLSHMCFSVFDQPMGAELAALPLTLDGPRLFGALTADLSAATSALERLEAEVAG